MGKAKPAKHTAAELAAKAKASTQNAGGGKAGLQDRKGGSVGHSRYKCYTCGQTAPDLKSMQVRAAECCFFPYRQLFWDSHWLGPNLRTPLPCLLQHCGSSGACPCPALVPLCSLAPHPFFPLLLL